MPCAVGVVRRCAIDDVIICRGQIRHVKHIAQREIKHTLLRHIHPRSRGDSKMHGHRRVRPADRDRHPVVLDQEAKLLAQVIAEQIRSCDRRGIRAGQGTCPKANRESALAWEVVVIRTSG